jgi:hypothetical protein
MGDDSVSYGVNSVPPVAGAGAGGTDAAEPPLVGSNSFPGGAAAGRATTASRVSDAARRRRLVPESDVCEARVGRGVDVDVGVGVGVLVAATCGRCGLDFSVGSRGIVGGAGSSRPATLTHTAAVTADAPQNAASFAPAPPATAAPPAAVAPAAVSGSGASGRHFASTRAMSHSIFVKAGKGSQASAAC